MAMHPRLVKEADTLFAAGYDAHVCAVQYSDWGTKADEFILSRAGWKASLLSWKGDGQRYFLWSSRIRRHACRLLLSLVRPNSLSGIYEKVVLSAYDRVLPELFGLVLQWPADLYIAHDLKALPIAVAAARVRGAGVGFDAEDFYSARKFFKNKPNVDQTIKEYFERRYIGQCDYMTAGSPGIAEAYARKYGIVKPVSILNVFPLSQRPKEFRPSEQTGPLTLYWFSQTIGANRGLEDVIQAMGTLRGCRIELHLRGNWQPGYRKQLFRFASSAGLRPDQIIAHSLELPDEMVRLAGLFDVGLAVEPGRGENNQIAVSNKLFVYLLAGNAVIATGTKGQRPIVEGLGNAAFCYDPGDIGALGHRLKMWFEDRESLEGARREAWDWGAAKYNWDLEKKKFLILVEKVLAS